MGLYSHVSEISRTKKMFRVKFKNSTTPTQFHYCVNSKPSAVKIKRFHTKTEPVIWNINEVGVKDGFVKWFKNQQSRVEEGEKICEIECSKVLNTILSPRKGTISWINPESVIYPGDKLCDINYISKGYKLSQKRIEYLKNLKGDIGSISVKVQSNLFEKDDYAKVIELLKSTLMNNLIMNAQFKNDLIIFRSVPKIQLVKAGANTLDILDGESNFKLEILKENSTQDLNRNSNNHLNSSIEVTPLGNNSYLLNLIYDLRIINPGEAEKFMKEFSECF